MPEANISPLEEKQLIYYSLVILQLTYFIFVAHVSQPYLASAEVFI